MLCVVCNRQPERFLAAIRPPVLRVPVTLADGLVRRHAGACALNASSGYMDWFISRFLPWRNFNRALLVMVKRLDGWTVPRLTQR
jgi:hypothetical protein